MHKHTAKEILTQIACDDYYLLMCRLYSCMSLLLLSSCVALLVISFDSLCLQLKQLDYSFHHIHRVDLSFHRVHRFNFNFDRESSGSRLSNARHQRTRLEGLQTAAQPLQALQF